MKKICMVSLGCSKNLVNSEKMLAEFAQRGAEFIDDPTQADEIIVNTCCFIDSAMEESVNTIKELGKHKAKLFVSGCLPERFGEELFDILPEIDGIINANEKSDNRLISTPKGTAYLKIAEGCNNACTFCVIPQIKGKYISFPHKEILLEAQNLTNQGAKELIIIAQDTTRWQTTDNRGQKLTLVDLLKDIAKISGIEWIRLHYCYPEYITAELIELIIKEPKIVKYIDIPIQHCNDEILRKMGRQSRKPMLISLIDKLHKADIVIRTSLMVGFPGETPKQFQELCDFAKEMHFERAGVFSFSPQEGTPAYDMPNQIPDDEKQRRFEILSQICENNAIEHAKSMVGKEIEIIVQSENTARTQYDSLDIDALVHLPTTPAVGAEYLPPANDNALLIGKIIKAKVTATDDIDLIATPT